MNAGILIATLKVGPHDVPVYEHAEQWEEDDCDAECHFDPYWIRIADRLQGPARWVAILHELVHLSFQVHGLSVGVYRAPWWRRLIDAVRGFVDWDEREELMCDLIGATLAQALAPQLGAPPSVPMPGIPGRNAKLTIGGVEVPVFDYGQLTKEDWK